MEISNAKSFKADKVPKHSQKPNSKELTLPAPKNCKKKDLLISDGSHFSSFKMQKSVESKGTYVELANFFLQRLIFSVVSSVHIEYPSFVFLCRTKPNLGKLGRNLYSPCEGKNIKLTRYLKKLFKKYYSNF